MTSVPSESRTIARSGPYECRTLDLSPARLAGRDRRIDPGRLRYAALDLDPY